MELLKEPWQWLQKQKFWQWLLKNWLGLLFTYSGLLVAIYLIIWKFGEPMGIPDTIDSLNGLPGFMKQRFFYHIILALLIASHLTIILEVCFRRKMWTSYRVSYLAHIQDIGWMKNWVSDGEIAGHAGQDKRIEAIRIQLGSEVPTGVGVTYQAHVEGKGWMDWKCAGETAGTTGRSRRMEAIRIKLEKAPTGYSVAYRVCVEGEGWMNWAADGETAGTTGESKRLEAIRILVVGP